MSVISIFIFAQLYNFVFFKFFFVRFRRKQICIKKLSHIRGEKNFSLMIGGGAVRVKGRHGGLPELWAEAQGDHRSIRTLPAPERHPGSPVNTRGGRIPHPTRLVFLIRPSVQLYSSTLPYSVVVSEWICPDPDSIFLGRSGSGVYPSNKGTWIIGKF